MPSLVEIEINSNCNLSCSYCPNSIKKRRTTGNMDPALFARIINQLAEYNYSGRIAFEFYNEPLLCPNFDDFVRLTKKKLPLTTLVLYTNAVKIKSKEKFLSLREIGVDQFVITHHEQVQNLEFSKVYDSLSLAEKDGVLFQHHTEMKKFNRAGSLPELGRNEEVKHQPCSVPSIILTVTVEGKVLSCFEDYEESLSFGSVCEKNIIEIWNDDRFTTFQSDLKNGSRQKYQTCSGCNRVDTKMDIQADLQKRINLNKHLIDDQEAQAVAQVLKSGKLFRYQKEPGECEKFEKEISDLFCVKHSLLVTSGTNALVAALRALEISDGDEVIIPAYTYVATAGAVINVGATPVVVNIDKSLMIDPSEIKKAITSKTKAIIPVHMDGMSCDMDAIMQIANKHGLSVVEDCAQAFGAQYKNKYLGSIGHLGCFSFNRDKTITCGEGGLVVTSDSKLSERLLCIADQGYSFNPLHQNKLKMIQPFLGMSMRTSEITGAILRVQLRKLNIILQENKLRKEILEKTLQQSEFYRSKFTCIEVKDSTQCHSSIHLQFNDPEIAAVLSKRFLANKVMAIPITLRPAHCVWKWGHFLKTPYSKAQYIQSMDILMSTLRMEIDISLSLEETKILADKIRKLVENTISLKS